MEYYWEERRISATCIGNNLALSVTAKLREIDLLIFDILQILSFDGNEDKLCYSNGSNLWRQGIIQEVAAGDSGSPRVTLGPRLGPRVTRVWVLNML